MEWGHTSLTLAVSLSLFGSLCYVLSLLSIAFPAHLVRTARNGDAFSASTQGCFLALYAIGQIGAGGSSTAASWYGPVSITLPVYMGSMQLWTLLLMSALGMQSYTKSQQVGTLVLATATTLLVDAGPAAGGAVVAEQLASPAALLWVLFMGVAWAAVVAGMAVDRERGQIRARLDKVGGGAYATRVQLGEGTLLAVYVAAQATSTSSLTTLGKLLVLVDGASLGLVLALLALTTCTNLASSIVAAVKINQATFIPMASCGSLVLNQATGLLLWGDGRTVRSWLSYAGVHVLILLGTYELSSADLCEHIRQRRSRAAETSLS